MDLRANWLRRRAAPLLVALPLGGSVVAGCDDVIVLECQDTDRVVTPLGRFDAGDFGLGLVLVVDVKTHKAVAVVAALNLAPGDKTALTETPGDRTETFKAKFDARLAGGGALKNAVDIGAQASKATKIVMKGAQRVDLLDPYKIANAQRDTILPSMQRELERDPAAAFVVVRSITTVNSVKLSVEGASETSAGLEIPLASGKVTIRYECAKVAEKTGAKQAAFFKVRGIKWDGTQFVPTNYNDPKLDFSGAVAPEEPEADAPSQWPEPKRGCLG